MIIIQMKWYTMRVRLTCVITQVHTEENARERIYSVVADPSSLHAL